MRNRRSHLSTKGLAIGIAVVLATAGLAACSSDSSNGEDSSTESTPYEPGTRSTAMSHPASPVISAMSYRTAGNKTLLVTPVSSVKGSDKDTLQATVNVYSSIRAQQAARKPIYSKTVTIKAGTNDKAEFELPNQTVSAIRKNNPTIGNQLVVVRVTQKVDGDADGHAEGTLNSRSSYHDSQISKAGETIDLTIGTNVAGVNVATIPIMCMYNDSGSDFAPLNATLAAQGDYVSSSIEADGDLFESPTYNGPAWDEIVSELTGDAAVDTVRLILSALSPVNVAIQAVADIVSLGIKDCDSQASIFQIAAAQPSNGNTTSQGYVASEQTSNGILTTGTALSWQQNMEEQGGAVWQTSVSDQYLQQMVNASSDNGLSLAGTPTEVGTWTLNTSWTFMINEGGSSSIPNGCDDQGC